MQNVQTQKPTAPARLHIAARAGSRATPTHWQRDRPPTPVLRLIDVGVGETTFSLDSYPGEIVHLSGGSQVARLRVLAMVAGFGHGGSGRCELLGHDLQQMDEAPRRALREQHVSRMLGCDHLPQAASVVAAVAMPLVRLGIPVAHALARAALELDALCAGALAPREPESLSRAEGRLALLARALVTRPRLLVLEQPEDGLLPEAVAAVRLALWALSSAFQSCVVMTTEHPRLIASADRTIDLDRAPTALRDKGRALRAR